MAKDLKKLLKKISAKDKKPLSPPKKKNRLPTMMKILKLYKMNKFNQKTIVKDPLKENIRRETRNKLMTLKRDTIIALKFLEV